MPSETSKPDDPQTRGTDYYESILRSMIDPVLLLSADANIEHLNPAAERLLGYAASELIGEPIGMVIDDAAARESGISALMVSGLGHGVERRLKTRNGNSITVLFSTSIIRSSGGGIDGIACFAKDISDRVRQEEELRAHEARLAHVGRLGALGEMATGIAHEINQPLTVLRGWMDHFREIALDGVLDPEEVATRLTKLIGHVDRISDIIAHMRQFTRKDTPMIHPIDPEGPVKMSLMFFEQQFKEHRIDLVKDIQADLPKVLAYDSALEQVLVNLLSNASHALDTLPEDAARVVRLKLENGPNEQEVSISVTDNGPGMDGETLTRCMEPFYTTKEVGTGTGLGLSISHGLMRQVSGRLELHSELGRGTTATMIVPAAAEI